MKRERESEVEYCFSCDVGFHYTKSIEQFEGTLEVFKEHSRTVKRNNSDDGTSLSYDEFFNDTEKNNPQPTYCYGRRLWLS